MDSARLSLHSTRTEHLGGRQVSVGPVSTLTADILAEGGQQPGTNRREVRPNSIRNRTQSLVFPNPTDIKSTKNYNFPSEKYHESDNN